MSVTDPRLPSVVARATVSPPEVRLLILASRSWTVIVDVEEPSAVMEVGAAVMRERRAQERARLAPACRRAGAKGGREWHEWL